MNLSNIINIKKYMSNKSRSALIKERTRFEMCRLPNFSNTSFHTICDIATFVLINLHLHDRIQFKQAPFLIKECLHAFPQIYASSSTLGPGIKGYLQVTRSQKTNKTQQTANVLFADFEPDIEQRFIIAHELGHYFLENQYLLKSKYFFPIKKEIFTEEEIDFFASELLAPLHLIDATIQHFNRTNREAELISSLFHVSVEVAKRRLNDLIYIMDLGLKHIFYKTSQFTYPDHIGIYSWHAMYEFICSKCPFGLKPMNKPNKTNYICFRSNKLKHSSKFWYARLYDGFTPKGIIHWHCYIRFREIYDDKWSIPNSWFNPSYNPLRSIDNKKNHSNTLISEDTKFQQTLREIIVYKKSGARQKLGLPGTKYLFEATFFQINLLIWAHWKIDFFIKKRNEIQELSRNKGEIPLDQNIKKAFEQYGELLVLSHSQESFNEYVTDTISKEMIEKFDIPTNEDNLSVWEDKMTKAVQTIVNEMGEFEYERISKLIS